ncbi:MAG TPA: hypothetical protein VH912_01600 [Streptosporangiaceae bacterium]
MRQASIKFLTTITVFALGYGVFGAGTAAFAVGSAQPTAAIAGPARHCC